MRPYDGRYSFGKIVQSQSIAGVEPDGGKERSRNPDGFAVSIAAIFQGTIAPEPQEGPGDTRAEHYIPETIITGSRHF